MEKAGDILKILLDKTLIKKSKPVSGVFSNWKMIAGIDIASHSVIKDISGSTLIIEVDHPGWIQIIQISKKNIIKKLQIKYPELKITDIRLLLPLEKKNT